MEYPSLTEKLLEFTPANKVKTVSPIFGGSLNHCLKAETDAGAYFIKINRPELDWMFEAEKFGLQTIEATQTVTVPEAFAAGKTETESYLILSFLTLDSLKPDAWEELGTQLARMHLHPAPKEFGFPIDNSIGLTPQKNQWMNDWPAFFATMRIEPQLRWIRDKYDDSELVALGDKLLDRMDLLFRGIEIRPSLIHGDLWSGNSAATAEGNPVLFDPACYYGHHEAELSIAKMFGSFSQQFYEAYHTLIPRAEGFEQRECLYRLYHTLNHYNLFESAYRPACLSLLRRLV